MSIEAQLAELSGEFARKENIYIAETFIESQSAKQPGRPVFNQMIKKNICKQRADWNYCLAP